MTPLRNAAASPYWVYRQRDPYSAQGQPDNSSNGREQELCCGPACIAMMVSNDLSKATSVTQVLTDSTGMTVDDISSGLTIVRKQTLAKGINCNSAGTYRGIMYFE